MKNRIFLKLIMVSLFLSLFSSCRLGEILSEADPDTEAEIDQKSDTIPEEAEIQQEAFQTNLFFQK